MDEQTNSAVGISAKTAEEIAKQKEQAKIAYSLLGIEMPEKAERKARLTGSGRKYKIGYKELVENGRAMRIIDLLPVEKPVYDSESLCRTMRAYIAYKIGHTLKEIDMQDGSVSFLFVNRISKKSKTLEVREPNSVTTHYMVAAFYKDCVTEITDKWGIFQDKNAKLWLLAVKAGHFHIVEMAKPDTAEVSEMVIETPEITD